MARTLEVKNQFLLSYGLPSSPRCRCCTGHFVLLLLLSCNFKYITQMHKHYNWGDYTTNHNGTRMLTITCNCTKAIKWTFTHSIILHKEKVNSHQLSIPPWTMLADWQINQTRPISNRNLLSHATLTWLIFIFHTLMLRIALLRLYR